MNWDEVDTIYGHKYENIYYILGPEDVDLDHWSLWCKVKTIRCLGPHLVADGTLEGCFKAAEEHYREVIHENLSLRG